MFIGVQGSYAMLLINLDGENKSSSLLLCFGMCCNHTMDLKMIRKRGIFSLALARKMQGHLRWYYDVAQRYFFSNSNMWSANFRKCEHLKIAMVHLIVYALFNYTKPYFLVTNIEFQRLILWEEGGREEI